MDQQKNNIPEAENGLPVEAAVETPSAEMPDGSAAQTPPAPAHAYAAPEIEDDEDDAPTEWVPSRFEKRVKAIPEKTWNLYQMLAGAAIGIFTVLALFYGGSGLNAFLIAALVLALFFPRWMEDRGRRRLDRLRVTMVIVLAAGILIMVLYSGFTKGWSFFAPKEAAEAAMRLADAARL